MNNGEEGGTCFVCSGKYFTEKSFLSIIAPPPPWALTPQIKARVHFFGCQKGECIPEHCTGYRMEKIMGPRRVFFLSIFCFQKKHFFQIGLNWGYQVQICFFIWPLTALHLGKVTFLKWRKTQFVYNEPSVHSKGPPAPRRQHPAVRQFEQDQIGLERSAGWSGHWTVWYAMKQGQG